MSVTTFDDRIESAVGRRELAPDALVTGLESSLAASSLQRLSTRGAIALGRRQAWHDLRSSAPLVLFDVFASGMAAITAVIVNHLNGESLHTAFVPCVILMVVMMHRLNGLYPACGLAYSLEFRAIMRTCAIVGVAVGFAMLLRTESRAFPWAAWATLVTMLFFCLCSIRPIARRFLSQSDWWAQPVLIVGDGEQGRRLYDRLRFCRHEGLRPIGMISDRRNEWQGSETDSGTLGQALLRPGLPLDAYGDDSGDEDSNHCHVLGSLSDLESILTHTKTCRLAMAEHDGRQWHDFHAFHGIPHVMMPMDLAPQPTERARMSERDGGIELHCYSALTSPVALVSKRVMDLVLILTTIPVWLPLMVLIAFVMKFTDSGPIFYRQSRVGRYRQSFRAIKFRSMVCDADRKLRDYLDSHPELKSEWEVSHKLKNDPRVTRIGEFLRKTSLDELPQLWNVLVGEMSLVGPRPIIDCGDYDRQYIQEFPEVFELYQMVRPGITGLWQVSGRNGTSYEQRVYYDRFYLQNWSLTLDIFILWRTIKTALFREGAC